MRKTLRETQKRGLLLSKNIQELNDVLKRNCSENEVREIKFKIHCLNSKLFDYFEDTKCHKFNNLDTVNQSPVLQNGQRNTDAGRSKLVVTIPEDLVLNDTERSVLQKGLKFVPARPLNKPLLEEDLEDFYRRLRLHTHFNLDLARDIAINIDPDDSTENPFQKFKDIPKSSWTPREGENKSLDTFIQKTRSDVDKLNLKWKHSLNNLTKSEENTLYKLKNRDDIVIKQADKGGATVVWSKDMYIVEGTRQLNDKKFYKSLEVDKTSENNDKVSAVIETEIKHKRLSPDSTSLIVKKPKCSKFYMLPKIHKPDYPTVGRPIVSTLNSPTEKISQFLDEIFQPLVKQLPSYVKDTTDFLLKIDGFKFQSQSSQYNLFTMDVKSLYTVIDNNEGLEAVKYFLEARVVKEPPTSTLLKLTEMVLTLNCFSFNNEYYQQVGGVCMGTRMGPSYANLYMGFLEHKIFQSFNGKIPKLYLRYIDDIFCAGDMDTVDINKFVDFYNSYNDNIKVTSDIGSSISFLDTTLTVNSNGIINSSIYFKPTDSHTYLRYDSSHPKSCKDGIPYSQFIRLRRICSSQKDFDTQANSMSEFFIERGYPVNIVNCALQKAKDLDRNSLLVNKSKMNSSRIPLVVPYNKLIKPVVRIVNNNFAILQSDQDIGCLFKEPPIVAYKRDANLSNILVSSSLKNKIQDPKIPGTFTCDRNVCKTCPHTSNKTTIQGPKGLFHIKNHFTCTSTGVVYAITCTKCGDIYIGETERKLGDRFREHLYFVNKQFINKSLVAQHFNLPDHSYTDMEISGLLYTDNDKYRKIVEKRIIRQLGTTYPLGMNTISN